MGSTREKPFQIPPKLTDLSRKTIIIIIIIIIIITIVYVCVE